jgi:two-component system sensor histidine kinase DegS
MQGQEQTRKRYIEEMHQRVAASRALEIGCRQANESLRDEQGALRQLLDLQERDRRLVAYELHDGLAQRLAGALVQLQALVQLSDWNSKEARKAIDAAIQSLNDGVFETRQLIRGLQPSILDHAGLAAAIDCLIAEVQVREGVKIEFDHNDQFGRLAPPLETAVFRIVQEALNNACRHSRSKKVRVVLLAQGGHIHVEVQDWGIGFDPGTVKENSFGLRGIRERAKMLDGQATIDSAPNNGTRVVVDLPVLPSPRSLGNSAADKVCSP